MTATVGSLFSGIGGLELGIGGRTVWHSELDKHASTVLRNHWPDVPNLGDITAINWAAVQPVDVIVGGFPCQPVSAAGIQRGTRDTRWMWPEFLRAIVSLQPSHVLIENVSALLTIQEEYDPFRCVCGWPRRWRGLSTNHPIGDEQEGLRIPGGRRDDKASGFTFESVLRSMGGDCDNDQTSHDEMGRSVAVGDPGVGGGSVRCDDLPVPSHQGSAGSVADGLSRSSITVGAHAHGQGDLDRRSTPAGSVAADDGAGSEQKRSGADASPEHIVDTVCPACGRHMDEDARRDVPTSVFGHILGDLAEAGYDTEWASIRASEVGAPHRRERIFIHAWPAADTVIVDAQRRRGPGHMASTGQPVETETRERERRGYAASDSGATPPDTTDNRLDRSGGAREWRIGSVDSGQPAADTDLTGPQRSEPAGRHHMPPRCDWGPYKAAIERWEPIIGRRAPNPTDNRGRLNPAFVEWMMGFPEGWVDGLTRAAALKCLGNAVVPQCAALAWHQLASPEAAGMTVDRCAHCGVEIVPTVTGWTHLDGDDDCHGMGHYQACNQCGTGRA